MSVLHVFYIAFSCTFSQSVYAYVTTRVKTTKPFAVLATNNYVKNSTLHHTRFIVMATLTSSTDVGNVATYIVCVVKRSEKRPFYNVRIITQQLQNVNFLLSTTVSSSFPPCFDPTKPLSLKSSKLHVLCKLMCECHEILYFSYGLSLAVKLTNLRGACTARDNAPV